MNCCSILHNKNIFTAYVGLIASGYNLAEISCIEKIQEFINDVAIRDEIVDYFKKAKTLSCEVNPYWPRAFLLTLACMYISEDRPCKYSNFKSLTEHINSLKQINPYELDKDVFIWLRELPDKLELLNTYKWFDKLWNNYLYEMDQYNEYYNTVISQAASAVIKIIGVNKENMPKVIVIPNPLQAPQATDIIEKDNKVYIIKSKPDKESVIHEILHHIFDSKLENCKEIVSSHLFLLKPVLEQMIQFQYAWSYDENSW